MAIIVSRQDAVDQVPLKVTQFADINQDRIVIDLVWDLNRLSIYLNLEMTNTMRIFCQDRDYG
jgi:hypothetical protein